MCGWPGERGAALPRRQPVCGALLPPAGAAAVGQAARLQAVRLAARMHAETLAELRRFYRLSRERKMTHIRRYS